MKKLLLVIFINLIATFFVNAQTNLPKNINDDFGYAVINNYFYRNNNIRIFLMSKLRDKGYEPMDIDVLVESIKKNTKNRNIIFEVFHDYFKDTDENYLYMNLTSLGISASNAKYLTDYILNEKYKSKKK